MHGFRYTARALFRLLRRKYKNEGKTKLGWVGAKMALADWEPNKRWAKLRAEKAAKRSASSGDGKKGMTARYLSDINDLAAEFLRRGTESAGLYQMFEVFRDVALIYTNGRIEYYEELPADVGMSFSRFKSFRVQVHYDNPKLEAGLKDNSGVRVW